MSQASGNQLTARSVSDGDGGVIAVWEDYRDGAADIYAQRIDKFGDPVWTLDGTALCDMTGSQTSPVVTTDGAGGAIVAWQDTRSGSFDIYAQAVSATGVVRWAQNGVAVCSATGDQVLEVITPDGQGGALIGWRDQRSGDRDVYAQRMSNGGVPLWSPIDGVGVAVVASSQQTEVRILADQKGGAFVVWRDDRNGNPDIYAQSLDENGVRQWPANGVVVCNATNNQLDPHVATDGRFGCIVTWEDARSGTSFDIFAQRVLPTGLMKWKPNGVPVCSLAQGQIDPIAVSDGAAGAIIAWTDGRASVDPDIFAQRVDSLGVPVAGWPLNGVSLCSSAGSQVIGAGVSDGLGGAIFGWDDDRAGFNEIFAQSVSADGTVRWGANGLLVATGAITRALQDAISDGFGGVIFTWQDFRNANDFDLYAQRLTSTGTGVAGTPPSPGATVALGPVRPNPFNPRTVIEFSLERTATLRLTLHDVSGRLVRVLADGTYPPGRHGVAWDGLDGEGRACASGRFYARLEHAQGSVSLPLVLLR